MIPIIIEIFVSLFCAIISGTVLWKIQQTRKIDDERRQSDIGMAVKDRELQLATAELTEMLARKIDGEGINGELNAAAEKVSQKREAVEQFTQEQYFEGKLKWKN